MPWDAEAVPGVEDRDAAGEERPGQTHREEGEGSEGAVGRVLRGAAGRREGDQLVAGAGSAGVLEREMRI